MAIITYMSFKIFNYKLLYMTLQDWEYKKNKIIVYINKSYTNQI